MRRLGTARWIAVRRWVGWSLELLTELAIVALAVWYFWSESMPALGWWITVSSLYLLIGWRVVRRRALRTRDPELRRGGLWYHLLSRLFPFAASLAGILSALQVLVVRNDSTLTKETQIATVAVGAVGIVISWLMLHVGFARLYQSTQDRFDDHAGLEFPGTDRPILADFLYFSFTIGSTFATSDVNVRSRRMRLLVLKHNVTSYFYSAAVVALAIQVLQQLGDSG